MSLATKYRHIDPRMIYDLATGMEDPDEVAKRYGFEGEEWEQLAQRPELVREVKQQAAELSKNGTTFKNKARLLTNSMLDDLYKAAMRDDVPVKDKAQALLAVTKLAGLFGAIAAATGHSKTAERAAKVEKEAQRDIKIKNLVYENGKFEVNGYDTGTLETIAVGALNNIFAKTK